MKINYLFLILFISTLFGFSQSLQETVEIALQNNKTILSQKAQTEAAALDYASSSADLWPEIVLESSYKHVTAVPEISFPGIPAGRAIELGLYDSYDAGIGINYVIFSGYALREQVNITAKKEKLSLTNQQNTERDVAINAIQQYRQVQFLFLQEKLLKASKDRIELQIKRVKALLDNGMALAIDTLSLSLAKAKAEQDIIVNKAALESTLQALKTTVGQKITPQKENDQQLPGYASFEAVDQLALQSIDLQKQITQSKKIARQSAYYPKLYAGASFRYGKPGLDFIKKDWMTYGVWNIGLSWSLWNWGADKKGVEAEKARSVALDYQREAISDALILKYDQAERELKSLKEQLNVTRKSVRLAREKMKIIEESAKEGQLSVTDFNDANLELLQSELNEQKILIQIRSKANELDYLSGKPISSWSLK